MVLAAVLPLPVLDLPLAHNEVSVFLCIDVRLVHMERLLCLDCEYSVVQ